MREMRFFEGDVVATVLGYGESEITSNPWKKPRLALL